MNKITRRSALTSIAAIPACGLAPIVPAMAEPVEDLRALADHHARQLADVMGKLHPRKAYRCKLDHEHGYVFIVGDEKARVNISDGSPLRADDVTGTTAFADWKRQQA